MESRQLPVQVNLVAQSNGVLTGSYSFTNVNGQNLSLRVYRVNDQGVASTEALYAPDISLVTGRDNISTGQGSDVVYAGAGGDSINDGAGDDFYDGGANGSGTNSWDNDDTVNFSGAQKRYAVSLVKYTDLAAGSELKARIDFKYSSANLPETIVRVADKVPDGEGINHLINTERIQFSDGQVNLGVSHNAWVPPTQQGGSSPLGSNNYTGGILNDSIDASGHDAASPTAAVAGFRSNSDWIDGGLGNDTLIGGAGADHLQGGKGDDVIVGGTHLAIDPANPWQTWDKYDEARFSNGINRYETTFFRAAKTGETGTVDNLGLSTGSSDKGYVASAFFDADGFIVVQDRYSDAMGGEGRDVLRGIEILGFSDASEQLKLQVNDNTFTQNNWSITGKDGSGNDTWGNIETTVTNRFISGTRFGDKIQGAGAYQNYLYGNAGNDLIIGGALRDELVGGVGNDTLDGGQNPDVDPTRPWDTWSTYDVARYDADKAQFKIQRLSDADGTKTGTTDQQYFLVEHLVPSSLGGLGTDIVFNIERLQFSGSNGDVQLNVKVEQQGNRTSYSGTQFADTIVGTAGDDNFSGEAGNDSIAGGAGNDFMGGGAGDDSLGGGDGDDQFVNLAGGNDTVVGGDGADTVTYEDVLARFTVQLVRGGNALASFSTSTGFGDETFTAETDTIKVTDRLASAYGGEGVDSLAAIETIKFNNGSISLNKGVYSFVSSSSAQSVNLVGTDGDDQLRGGAGNDTLDGGTDTATLGTNFWGGGDQAQYLGAARQRFDIVKNLDGSFIVIDIASVITPVFGSDGHLNPSSYDSGDKVSQVIGYGIDTLKNIERISFSDGQLDLAPLDVTNTYQSYLYVNGVQGASYQVTQHNITGTFLGDLLLGSQYGDQIDGRGGDDTIDGGVETVSAGNTWEIQDVVRYEGSRERYEIKGVLVEKTGSGSTATYNIVSAANATSTAVFGLQVKDVLPLENGGTGTDLLVNVERVEFAAGSSSTGSNSINIKPEFDYYDDWSASTTVGSKPQAVNARGTDFADALRGTDNGDRLSGNAGNDTLSGGAGGDELEGDAGDDLLLGGANGSVDAWGNVRSDTARFNAPFDRFEVSATTVDLDGDGSKETAAMQVRDLLPSEDPSSMGTDILVGVENLAFSESWLDLNVRRWQWTDPQGVVSASAEGTVFSDIVTGDRTLDGITVEVRSDQLRGNLGHDVLLGLGGGDNLQGGEGNDVLDGGANGSTGDAWRDLDQARFAGKAQQYTVQGIAINTVAGNSTIAADGKTIATFNSAGLTVTATDLAAGVADVLRLAYQNLTLTDGQHSSGYLVVDTLSSDLGGEGADLVFNVETLWFADGPLEIDIRANSDDWNKDGNLDWVNVTGTANNDSIDMAKLVSLTGKLEAALTATRIDVDLRDGNDIFVGGSGGESIGTGAGNDYVDGGANTGTDQWGGQMRDEVRFEGNFSRYNLINVTLVKAANAWTLSSSTLDLTNASTTVTAFGAGAAASLAALSKADINAALTNMVANAGQQTSLSGWLVADRLPSLAGGSGVDALVNVEALSFGDKWMPLNMQIYYQRESSIDPSVKWETLPIVSAYVDGTQGNDTIGYSSITAAGQYNYTGDDNLRGNEGNDSIYGGAGGDWISAGEGDDLIDGGANGALDQWGNTRIDTVQYEGEFARYSITPNSNGSVTVSDSQTDGDGTDTLTNIEAIGFKDRYLRLGVETWLNKDKAGKVTDVSLNGSLLGEVIDVSADAYPGVRHNMRGNEGNDTLIGGAGPDDFEGGIGDDSMVGGANGKDAWGNPGFDVARYQGAFSRYAVTYSADQGETWAATNPGGAGLLVRVTDSFSEDEGGQGVDTLSGIEALSFFDRFVMLEASKTTQDLDGDGRPDNAQITGTEAADVLIGDATNDRIMGAGGADNISGGKGGDVLMGGAGNDTLDGGDDGVSRSGSALIDVAEYSGAAALYTITKNANGSFTVASGSGASDGTDTLTNIEGLQFSDSFISLLQQMSERDLNKDGVTDLIEIRGTDLAAVGDTITTLTDKSMLAYRMSGGLGNDTLTGGTGADIFEGGAGNDSIVGGDGTAIDRAVFSGNYADYDVSELSSSSGSLTVSHKSSGPNGTDTLSGIEELAFADRVVKLGAADVVATKQVDTDGNQKIDTAYTSGTDRADTIDFSSSTLVNVVDAGAGNDNVRGGSRADTFVLGAGNDTVDGGANDGLDASGNPNMDRVQFSGAKADYTVKALQMASFTVSGAVEVGDLLSVTVGATTVSYVATGTTLAALKTGLDAALASAGLASGISVTSTLAQTGVDYQVKSIDSLVGVSSTAGNGSHAVAGTFTVNGASQSGTSFNIKATDGVTLEAGEKLRYVVDANANGSTADAGDISAWYTIKTATKTVVSGASDNWALTLTDTLGTAPADGAVVSVTESNTDTTLAVTAMAYDRWFEAANKTGTVETDTLRGIEQLLFSDVALDLSFKTAQKAVFGANGLTTVTKVTGTELADILRSTGSNEIFTGGLGADRIVISDVSGTDEVRGFAAGAGGDIITAVLGLNDTDGLNASGVDTASKLMAKGAQQGADVLVDLGLGNSLRLVGVLVDDLKLENFGVLTAI